MTDLSQASRRAIRFDNPLQLPDIHAALEQQRRFRIAQLAELDVSVGWPADGPRNEVTLLVRAAAASALADIDAALNRIQLGCYGQCQRCATPISLERLSILPAVALCMPCQAAHDNRTRGPLVTGTRPTGATATSLPADRLSTLRSTS